MGSVSNYGATESASANCFCFSRNLLTLAIVPQARPCGPPLSMPHQRLLWFFELSIKHHLQSGQHFKRRHSPLETPSTTIDNMASTAPRLRPTTPSFKPPSMVSMARLIVVFCSQGFKYSTARAGSSIANRRSSLSFKTVREMLAGDKKLGRRAVAIKSPASESPSSSTGTRVSLGICQVFTNS